MKLLDRFALSANFLKVDQSQWNSQINYIQGQKIIESLWVANDIVEREATKEFNDESKKKTRRTKTIFNESVYFIICN